jgi:hypothetical protein
MNNLWQQYIQVLLQHKQGEKQIFDANDCGIQTSLCSKLTKADFTGAEVKVVNAKNTQLVGTTGLVVRETTRTFIIIRKDDTTIMLLK